VHLCSLQLQEELTTQIRVLKETQAVRNNLKKKVETQEQVLKNVTDKQTQMQTAIDGLIKAVEIINLRSQALCMIQTDVSTCKVPAIEVG
jgi:predicted DNA-binding ArsR family transcriptional regulator